MKKPEILLGIDFGTGGCKVSAVAPDGALLGEASVEYATEYTQPGWSEQNPQDWFPALQAALRKLPEQGVELADVKALALDGSTHNAVLLDRDWKPLRKTIMWTDQRSVAECKFLQQNYGELIFQTAYQKPTPTWTLPQLLWLKNHEPEVLAKTKHLLFVKDYVRFLLTGVAVSDHIEAQGTLFYDMQKRVWSRKLVALSGLNFSALPDLVNPSDRAGEVTPSAAVATGLPPGTPVICGTSDSAVEDYGAGAIEPGDCIIKLATAGNVNVMTAEPHPFATTLTYSHVIPGMWYTVSATNAAALCQRWFRDLFCDREKQEAEQLGVKTFEIMGQEAAKSPIGAQGVMFHPYLQGERSPYWDAKLRASFTGISIASPKRDFFRAVLEGVAFSLRDCYGSIEELGLPVKQIFLIGGGARGKLWSQIIADVFAVPVQVPIPGDASYGSALLAGTGIGLFENSAEAVRKCLRIERRIEPIAEHSEQYQALFRRYKAIQAALAPIYHCN
ncbi:MAG: xylulokinase [Lentisphaeria bacterium]